MWFTLLKVVTHLCVRHIIYSWWTRGFVDLVQGPITWKVPQTIENQSTKIIFVKQTLILWFYKPSLFPFISILSLFCKCVSFYWHMKVVHIYGVPCGVLIDVHTAGVQIRINISISNIHYWFAIKTFKILSSSFYELYSLLSTSVTQCAVSAEHWILGTEVTVYSKHWHA